MICPFCDQPITDEPGVPFGGDRLHRGCHNTMNEDLDAAFPLEDDQQVLVAEQHANELEEAARLCGA